MSDSSSEQKSTVKPTIKIGYQTLKEYSQSYYWGNEIKSVLSRVVPGVIKFFSRTEILSDNAQLSTSSCIRIFWRTKGRISGHNGQQIDALVVGDYLDYEFKSEKIIVESIELWRW